MQYPPAFILAVKRVFPNWQRMHDALDNGSAFVGRYLDDSRGEFLSVETVLAATSLTDLQAEAHRLQEISQLYETWAGLYEQDRQP